MTTTFSHLKPSDTDYVSDGLREFFLYRDLGVAKATNGKVVVQLVKANLPPETGTCWHYHVVYMLRGWAKFMYEDKETLVAAGDCVQQRRGIVHYLFDYSPDMEFLEIVPPAVSPWRVHARCRRSQPDRYYDLSIFGINAPSACFKRGGGRQVTALVPLQRTKQLWSVLCGP